MAGADVAIASLGIMATITGALVWLLKKLFNQNDGTIKQNNLVLNRLALSIEKSASASVALQTSIKDRDARDREFHSEVMRQFQQLNDKADRAIEAIGSTTVKQQHVETQIVKQEVVREKKAE